MNDKIIPAEFEIVKTGISALGKPEDMRNSLDINSKRLEIVHDYIKDNFAPDVDFGETDSRSSKKTLMKPGAEKICKLFNTTARWRMDTDTWTMTGSQPGKICYICEIVENSTGRVIGEGRGAAETSEKGTDLNKTIKKAEKRSLVDAALYTFNLSSIFTQDMGDKTTMLSKEKQKLWEAICDSRIGVDSSLSNADFYKIVSKSFCHGDPRTVGAMRALQKAVVDDCIFDLATGERIPS